ncbi:recombination directionality factor [Duganella vulcania]|uniref:Uncharacterized protein n=1 Tax=Duganella vulcania TaxID=2692166 RepID=A0A845GT95_9BURK|nr:hypothetical protein [Duganella vulcania]MYM96456.1 hypothetical protein [Duganella vulcania]
MKSDITVLKDSRTPVPTVLGQRSARIPTAGKIRAGIKVLTRRAQDNAHARDIYQRGIEEGRGFDDIERALAQALPDLQHPLVPKNVPYFTVRGADFPNPETARQMLDLYGEDRGDGVRRLYRFPVVFPADVWQAVMPHDLVCWGAGEKKFWSEYAADGRTRLCKCYAPVPQDRTSRKPIRIFGGRRTQLRAENSGMCDPELCPEYQARKCNLSGRFIFYVPGIRSCDAFELPTNSLYSMTRAIEKFEALAFLRGGRISGFLDAKRTPFYISKVEREVPHIDEQGRSVRTKVWLIEMEAPIDVAALLNVGDGEIVREADAAAMTFEAPPSAGAAEDREPSARDHFEPEANTEHAGTTVTAAAAPMTGGGIEEVEAILGVVDAFGMDRGRFEAFAQKRWGAGWKRNAGGRSRVLAVLEGCEDAAALAAEVDGALGAASEA